MRNKRYLARSYYFSLILEMCSSLRNCVCMSSLTRPERLIDEDLTSCSFIKYPVDRHTEALDGKFRFKSPSVSRVGREVTRYVSGNDVRDLKGFDRF
jgi:hypothetical protein